MTMEQIDFFLMTVRCDTFLEAAENLHIAQSTLSKQIQKLESELNLTLFDRTRRQAVLTPAGELFCQEASELSRQYHQMLQKMRHFKESERQPLRVGSLPFLTQYHLTSRIRAFAPTPTSIHGSTPHLVMIDEAWAFDAARGEDLIAAINPAQITLRDRQLWIVSSQGDAASAFLDSYIDLGRASARAIEAIVGSVLGARTDVLGPWETWAPELLELEDEQR